LGLRRSSHGVTSYKTLWLRLDTANPDERKLIGIGVSCQELTNLGLNKNGSHVSKHPNDDSTLINS
jgi:hypothetical protein